MSNSVFAAARGRQYPYRYRVSLVVHELHGGTPMNQDVAVDHIKRQLAERGDLLRDAVADYLADQVTAGEQPDVDDAAAAVAMAKNLNGFRRDDEGLFIEGRHLKAALKESVSIAANAGALQLKNWGDTNKWVTKWFPEHVFVVENRLHLGRADADGISQRFVVSRHGTGISLEEYVLDAKITATIECDADLGETSWEAIWTRLERNGLGASRSQGYGTCDVVEWEALAKKPTRQKKPTGG